MRGGQPQFQSIEDDVLHLRCHTRQLKSYTTRPVLRITAQGAQDAVRQAVDHRRGIQLLHAAPVGVHGGVPQPARCGLVPSYVRRRFSVPYEVLRRRLRLALHRLLRQAHRAQVAARAQGAQAVRVLDRVEQLVGEQALAVGRARAVGALAEEDVLADRDRVRAQ